MSLNIQSALVSDFLHKNRKRWGTKIVLALQKIPNEPVHVLQLSHLIEPPEYGKFSFEQVERMIKKQEKIPQTDGTTLRQVNNEINRLVKMKANRLEMGVDCTDIITVLEQLVRYREETTRPNRSIKNFRLENGHEYQRHQSAVKRLLQKAKRKCPEAYHYIRSHLKMGTYFIWLSDSVC